MLRFKPVTLFAALQTRHHLSYGLMYELARKNITVVTLKQWAAVAARPNRVSRRRQRHAVVTVGRDDVIVVGCDALGRRERAQWLALCDVIGHEHCVTALSWCWWHHNFVQVHVWSGLWGVPAVVFGGGRQLLPRARQVLDRTQLIARQLDHVDRLVDVEAVAVPGHPAIDALVLVPEVLVEIPVEDRVEASVGRPEEVQETVHNLLVAGHAEDLVAGLAELWHELEDVERQPRDEEDAGDGDDDVVDPAATLVRVLELK